jgi:hypothetical protein
MSSDLEPIRKSTWTPQAGERVRRQYKSARGPMRIHHVAVSSLVTISGVVLSAIGAVLHDQNHNGNWYLLCVFGGVVLFAGLFWFIGARIAKDR